MPAHNDLQRRVTVAGVMSLSSRLSRQCRNSRAFKVATGFEPSDGGRWNKSPEALAGSPPRATRSPPPSGDSLDHRRELAVIVGPATVKLDGAALRFPKRQCSCCALVVVGGRDHLDPTAAPAIGGAHAPRTGAGREAPVAERQPLVDALPVGFSPDRERSLAVLVSRADDLNAAGHVCGVRFKRDVPANVPAMCVDREKRLETHIASFARKHNGYCDL